MYMATSLEGKDTSLWVETTPQTNYPKLTGDDTVYDVLVIGGGITGVMAAYYAQLRGLKTVLIEKNRLIEWTTGNTTAKLTSQHYLLYQYLTERHGIGTAQAYADANERGISKVAELSESLGIDSEFSRQDAYVFTGSDSKLHDIRNEVEAALKLGLPASFESTVDLPFDTVGAIKFSNQAQFHPRKFLLGIVDRFVALGGVVYEHTKATDIIPGDITSVSTKDGGDLRAKYVIQANGTPFWHKDIFEDRMWSKMSYALAVTLKDPAAYPDGLYITTDDPLRTIRTASYEGKPIMIFGGESHEFDPNDDNPDLHYQRLIDDVHRRFDVDQVCFRWLAGDYMPYDRMPYIGSYPDYPTVYTATGYRAWGLAWAMSAAEAIVDDIAGQPTEWAKPFSLDRLKEPPRESDKVYGI
jgi:glycine/D-amino acid oxidase-like deaminating enzyme